MSASNGGEGMARINIEDSIYKDIRFISLVSKLGDLDRALGALVRAWSLAQKWYVTPDRTIPDEEWKKNLLPEEIINVGLAQRVGSRIRVMGSDEQFAWLQQRIDAGRKGGQATAKRSVSDRLAVEQPLSLPLSPSLKTKTNTLAQSSIERVKFDLELLYQKYPRKQGKSLGLKKAKTQIKTQADFDALSSAIDAFCRHHKKLETQPEYIPYFSTFMASWKDWLEPETGKITPIEKIVDPKKQAELDQIDREMRGENESA